EPTHQRARPRAPGRLDPERERRPRTRAEDERDQVSRQPVVPERVRALEVRLVAEEREPYVGALLAVSASRGHVSLLVSSLDDHPSQPALCEERIQASGATHSRDTRTSTSASSRATSRACSRSGLSAPRFV